MAAEKRREALRARRVGLGISAAGTFALAAPASAAAVDYQVTSLNDGPVAPCTGTDCATLRDAVAASVAATGADAITFASGLTGTLRLTQGQLEVSGTYPITVTGPGADSITISGDADNSNTPNAGDSRIFNVVGGLTVSGLTLTEGYAVGTGGPPPPPTYGGAIQAAQDAPVTITDSVISGNTVSGSGGAVGGKYAGEISIEDSTISGNTATGGGGGAVFAGKYGGATITESTISGNTATGAGGGINAGGKYSPLDLIDSTVSGNTAGSAGGVFLGNKYCVSGPCTAAGPSDSEIRNTTISGNHATGAAPSGTGAGMAVGTLIQDDELSVTHTTISGNDGGAGSLGGGLAFTGTLNGNFDLVDSTVSGNLADVGGGIGTPNSTTTPGPAIPLVGVNGSITLDNSTMAANNARVAGGGIYLGRYPDGGGGYTSGTIPLGSTIVGDNTANGNPQDLDRENTSTGGGFDLAFSLVEVPGDAPINQLQPSLIGTDPRLLSLAANGGPTQTQRPAFNSPVVDQGAANGLLTDQRGLPRVVEAPGIGNASDGTDIGAVELTAQELMPPPNPPTPPGPTGPTATPGPSFNLKAAIAKCKKKFPKGKKRKRCIRRARAKA